jgi:hypothetical protein
MIAKLLLAIAVAYAGWLVWRGPRRPPIHPPSRPRHDDGGHAEARAILGVAADADEHDIRAAHRRLISVMHPDRGGSAELTRRINAARDALLQRPDRS